MKAQRHTESIKPTSLIKKWAHLGFENPKPIASLLALLFIIFSLACVVCDFNERYKDNNVQMSYKLISNVNVCF